MRRIAIVAFLFWTASLLAGDPELPPATRSATWALANYHSKKIKNLDKVPETIRGRVTESLREHVGDVFFGKLYFVAGRQANPRKLQRNGYAKYYKGQVPSYELHFGFRAPEAGIRRYELSVMFDAEGNLISDIELPNIARAGSKAQLISLPEAAAIAASHGFPDHHTRRLEYDGETDSIVWLFSRVHTRFGWGWEATVIVIDGHTGAVMRTFEERTEF